MRSRAMLYLLILLVILTSGCWNRRDPEFLGKVLATAFDYNPETRQYHVIAQVANPLAFNQEGSGTGTPGEPRSFWVISSDGLTPFLAMRNLLEASSRELFWAHNRVVLFSERLARHGIQPVMDLIRRERQLRTIARPLVVEGDLRTLMEAEYPLEESSAQGLERQIATLQFNRGIFPVKFLTEAYNTLAQPGKEMLLGRLEVLDQQDDGSTGMITPPAKVGGGAAFKGDKMVGWLTPDQTSGWNYINDRVVSSTHAIQSPEDDRTLFAVDTTRTDSVMRPIIDGDDVRIHMIVRTEARIQEFFDNQQLAIEDETTRSITRRVAEKIRNRIEGSIAAAQAINSDVFGFGNLIYRKDYPAWQRIEDRWEEIFPELVVDLDVEVMLLRAGLAKSPPPKSGGN